MVIPDNDAKLKTFDREQELEGILSDEPAEVKDVSSDAVMVLCHPAQDYFGFMRVEMKDVMVPYSYEPFEERFEAFIDRYHEQTGLPREQIKIKIYGGEHVTKIEKDGILLHQHRKRLAASLVRIMQSKGVQTRYVETTKEAVKTLRMYPRDVVQVLEEVVDARPTFGDYDDYMRRASKTLKD